MPGGSGSRSDRCYRALLRLLPFDFRTEFGTDMEEAFREQRADAAPGKGAWIRMWWTTARDLAGMAPREHGSVLAQDTRFALRMLRRSPGYTLGAIVILALGIGANSAIFSVVNSVLLKPLPYAQDEQIVMLEQRGRKADTLNSHFSAPEIADYRTRSHSLSALVEYHSMLFTLLDPAGAQRVRTGVVSANFFDFFGVRPMLGRGFRADDEKPGAPAVLLLTYEFWKQRLQGDPAIAGKTFAMNDRAHTVIGVLPPLPQYPDDNDVYMTTAACPFRSASAADRNWRLMSVFARLKPGFSPESSRAELAGIAQGLEKEYPANYPKTPGYTVSLATLRDELTRKARPMLLLLFGAAGFVLLIACANVANLILARMSRREKELAIRSALGAGAHRILRQLVTENLILSLAAAACGLGLAASSLSVLKQFAGPFTPRAQEIGMDGRVLLFAIFCAVGTAVICGSAAAFQSRKDIPHGTREGNARAARLRAGLIAAQVAFSYVLLVGAGLVTRSFVQLQNVNPGFQAHHVLAMAFDLNWSKYREQEQIRLACRRLLERVEAGPGVLSAALASGFPLDPDAMAMGRWTGRFRIHGRNDAQSEVPAPAAIRVVTPGYFRTLGIPLLGGRLFLESDQAGSAPLVVISAALAKHYWQDKSPLGDRISFDGDKWLTIAGVVGDVREYTLDHDAPEQVYATLEQFPSASSLLVRTDADPATALAQARRAILELDPQIAIRLTKTLDEVRADSISPPRALSRVFGFFAVLALVIAIGGLASMLALSIQQRQREIGIRIAVGATPGAVIAGFVRQGLLLTGVGLGVGFACAFGMSRLLGSLLFEVTPTDPLTFAAVAVLLLAAAFAACVLPARQAARVDPQIALRSE